MLMLMKTVKFYLSFILIISLLSGTASVCSAFMVPSVTEIDILIKPGTFDALTKEENRKKEYTVLTSVNNSVYESVTVNTRGSSTFEDALGYDTRRFPFEITFQNHSGEYEKNYSLKLNNSFSLYSLIAEYLAVKIYEHMDVPVSEVSPVFLSFNGIDFGLYLGVEDVNKRFITRRFGADALENGNLYRPVDLNRINEEDVPETVASAWFEALYCKAGTKNQRMLNAFINALDNETDYEQYLDMDEVLRYFACTASFGGADTLMSSVHNFYLYESEGKFIIIPWDLSFSYDCFDDRYGIYPSEEHFATSRFFNLIMSDKANLEKYCRYIEEIRETFLKPEIINPLIEDFVSEIKEYYLRDRSTVLDAEIQLDNITSGNILVNGNISLAVNEVYRQLGEQLRGESEYFYIPSSVKRDLLSEYSTDELRSDNDADVLTDIKKNYTAAYLSSSVDTVSFTVIVVFAVVLFVLFTIYRIPKGRTRKRNKT